MKLYFKVIPRTKYRCREAMAERERRTKRLIETAKLVSKTKAKPSLFLPYIRQCHNVLSIRLDLIFLINVDKERTEGNIRGG